MSEKLIEELIPLSGANEPLLEMADIMSRDQNYGFLITVFSNDHNSPHAHVLDLNRKDMGQIEITNEAPKTVEDICLYRTASLPLKVKKSIVEWANQTDPDFNCPYWVTLKNFWKRFQASS